ncbi:capsule biosynthesis protein [Sphingomonas sp. NCPPB 2930]|uniref:capsule biosynthesis protein n=1 Tax=unclassified Sphingomonas TaxID=196159 RepID=UPI0028602293|nr:capsule biosynthesis protein [Sphingomonas sp. SORGH_AS_0870]MDR6144279.1 hypothetical protein [Sphingomonas sp. SORGH_AS_0870]
MTAVHRWILEPRWRRIGYLAIALVLAVLCVVPRPWVARAKLLPQDANSAGLGQVLNSLGGQLATFANLFSGGKPPNDLYVVIGRSMAVTDRVINSLKLVGPDRQYATVRDARIALAKEVDIHLLLGGVLEVETRTYDADTSMRITTAYVDAISDRIAALTRNTIAHKSKIVHQRFREAGERVVRAEQALDAFRRANHLASPEQELGSAIALRASLQAQLAAKQVELRSVEQVAGPENPQLAAVRAQVAALQGQVASTGRPTSGASGPNVAGLGAVSSRYLDLYRDYRFAEALYEVYSRATEQVEVENLSAESASYIQTIEPVNVDAERHYNVSAVALLILTILMAVFTELYAPLTGLEWKHIFSREHNNT